MPERFNDFNWADHEFLRSFLCDHIKVEYWENQLFDPVNYPAEWNVKRDIWFDCKPMQWVNSKLRIVFVMPSKNHKITNHNENPEVHEQSAQEVGSYLKSDMFEFQDSQKEEPYVFFIKSNTFSNGIRLTFEVDWLRDVVGYNYFFHATELKNGPDDDYNSWNFTNTKYWDSLTNVSFWYSHNTTILFHTERYKIGS